MIYVLAALNLMTLVAFVVLSERRDQRQHEERQAHRGEIANLLQRIQAPEVAVQQQAAQSYPTLPVAVPLNDSALAERMQEVEEMERRLNAQVNGHFHIEDEIT